MPIIDRIIECCPQELVIDSFFEFASIALLVKVKFEYSSDKADSQEEDNTNDFFSVGLSFLLIGTALYTYLRYKSYKAQQERPGEQQLLPMAMTEQKTLRNLKTVEMGCEFLHLGLVAAYLGVQLAAPARIIDDDFYLAQGDDNRLWIASMGCFATLPFVQLVIELIKMYGKALQPNRGVDVHNIIRSAALCSSGAVIAIASRKIAIGEDPYKALIANTVCSTTLVIDDMCSPAYSLRR